MKIYRQSIWKADATKSCFVPFLFVQLLFLPMVYGTEAWLVILLVLSGAFLIFFLFTMTGYSYIITDSKKLVIKNLIYPFYSGAFDLKEIEKIQIGSPGGLSPNQLLIFRPGKRRKRFVIELVGSKNCRELIKDLQAKGIQVEVKGLL